jgi:hypothetical protein
VHDTSELELKGIPTVFVSTVEFVDGAETQAKAIGFQHTAVYVEHPIQDRTDAEMVEIADEAVEAVVVGLTGSR